MVIISFRPQGKKMLVPLTASLYVPGTLDDADKILVDVGTGYFVEGTFIECIHNFITFGAYDYFLRFVGWVCGDRGMNAVLSVEYHCCYRSNPTLQCAHLELDPSK